MEESNVNSESFNTEVDIKNENASSSDLSEVEEILSDSAGTPPPSSSSKASFQTLEQVAKYLTETTGFAFKPELKIKCFYCNIEQRFESLGIHAVTCPEQQKFEPKRECRFCREEMSESRTFIHEVTNCELNPKKKSFESGDLTCPKCKSFIGNFEGLTRHLGSVCLEQSINLCRQSLLRHIEDNFVKAEETENQTNKSVDLESGSDKENGGMTTAGDRRKSKTPTRFVCVHCNAPSKSRSDLIVHGLACEGIGKFEVTTECKFCLKLFKESATLKHQVTCDQNPDKIGSKSSKPIPCPKCETSVQGYGGLRVHLSSVCLPVIVDATQMSLDNHYGKQTEPDNTESESATKDIPSNTSVIKRKRRSSAVARYQCFHCNEPPKDRVNMMRHALTCKGITSLEPKRPCQYCHLSKREGLTLLHEASCQNNPNRIRTRDKDKTTCGKCKTVVAGHDQLRYHLVKRCLPVLIDATKKSLENRNPESLSSPNTEISTGSASAIGLKKTKKTVRKRRLNKTKVTCAFCETTQLRGSFRLHTIACPEINRLEPRRHCSFCSSESNESSSIVHEAMCKQNPDRIGRKSKDAIACPKCKTVVNGYRSLKWHLACKCLPVLVKARRKALGLDSSNHQGKHLSDNVKSAVRINVKKMPIMSAQRSSAFRKEDAYKCLYCDSTQMKRNLRCHALACPGLEKFETLRKCAFCQLESRESQSIVHEAVCKENPVRIICTSREIVPCPKCKAEIGGYRALRSHVSGKCVPALVKATNKTLKKGRLPDKKAEHDDNDVSSDNVEEPETETSNQSTASLKTTATPTLLSTRSRTVLITPSLKRKTVPSTTESTPDNVRPAVADGKRPRLSEIQNKPTKPKDTPIPAKTIESTDEPRNCPFCSKKFPSMDSLKEHPLGCLNMKACEPRCKCRFCDILLPISLCGLHEVFCGQNPRGVPMTKKNIDKNIDIRCPSCHGIFELDQIKRHLPQCIPIVSANWKNAIENPGLNWDVGGGSGENFLAKAGLDILLT